MHKSIKSSNPSAQLLILHAVLGGLVYNILHGNQFLHEGRSSQNLDIFGVVFSHQFYKLFINHLLFPSFQHTVL